MISCEENVRLVRRYSLRPRQNGFCSKRGGCGICRSSRSYRICTEQSVGQRLCWRQATPLLGHALLHHRDQPAADARERVGVNCASPRVLPGNAFRSREGRQQRTGRARKIPAALSAAVLRPLRQAERWTRAAGQPLSSSMPNMELCPRWRSPMMPSRARQGGHLRGQRGACFAEGVAAAGLDEGFEHDGFRCGCQPLAAISQQLKLLPACARRQNAFHRNFSHTFDRREPKANRSVRPGALLLIRQICLVASGSLAPRRRSGERVREGRREFDQAGSHAAFVHVGRQDFGIVASAMWPAQLQRAPMSLQSLINEDSDQDN